MDTKAAVSASFGSGGSQGWTSPGRNRLRGRTGSGLSGAAAAKAGREPLVKFVEHLERERGRSEALNLGEVTASWWFWFWSRSRCKVASLSSSPSGGEPMMTRDP